MQIFSHTHIRPPRLTTPHRHHSTGHLPWLARRFARGSGSRSSPTTSSNSVRYVAEEVHSVADEDMTYGLLPSFLCAVGAISGNLFGLTAVGSVFLDEKGELLVLASQGSWTLCSFISCRFCFFMNHPLFPHEAVHQRPDATSPYLPTQRTTSTLNLPSPV